jgi:hypothetical protein
MKIALISAPCLVILAGLAVAASSDPPGASAETRTMCPMFLAKFCVADKGGAPHTEMTNPCFAKQKGLTVVHMGECAHDHD